MSTLILQEQFFARILTLFRKSFSSEKIIEKQMNKTDFSRIRCPQCKWQPKKSSHWSCSDAPENFFSGCYTSWNTFETRGLCPRCFYQWRRTTCLSCHRDSPHENWYLNENE